MDVSVNVGDKIAMTGTITEVASGDAVDPTAVKAWTRSPAGTVTTYTYGTDAALTKTATGHYKLVFDVDTSGQWYAGFYSNGNGKASSRDLSIYVNESARQ